MTTFWLPNQKIKSIISLSYPFTCDPTIAKLAIFNVNDKNSININSMLYGIVKVCLCIYVEIRTGIGIYCKNKHISIG